MITMPISDYPASSSDSAQIQVMAEKKGEISQQLQAVRESPMDEREKSAATERLRAESDHASAVIRHKQAEKSDKEKLQNRRLLHKETEKQALQKQELQKQELDSSLLSKTLLDKRV